MNSPYRYYYALMPLVVWLFYCTVRAVTAPFSDYAGYYFGSLQLLQGHYHTAYDTAALNFFIAQKGYTGLFVSYTPFPPFTSVVFAPFLLLPLTISKIVFNIFSVGLFVYTVVRSSRFFSIPVWLAALIPVFFLIPLRNNIFWGQSYLLLCVLLLEGYMAYKQGRLWLSSLLWAIAILFKIFPVFILFFLLARRRYQQLLYCAGACAVLGSLSLLFTGIASWQFYISVILPRVNNGELNDSFTYVFQSAFMLLKKLFVYDAMQNPGALYDNAYAFVASTAFFKALILACCVGISLSKKVTDLMAFAAWIMAAVLVSPNGSTYSLILLLIPLLALPAQCHQAGKKPAYLYAAAGLICVISNIPVQMAASLPLWLQFPRLYLLLAFFFFVFILTRSSLPYKMVAVFFAILVLLDIRKLRERNDNSVYFAVTGNQLMIYDYAIKNNRLVYYYWDDRGSHEVVTGYVVNEHSLQDIQLRNNQVHYKGRPLTNTPDWKKKPMLVNGQVVYLSDKNRGVGFYTLRTVNGE